MRFPTQLYQIVGIVEFIMSYVIAQMILPMPRSYKFKYLAFWIGALIGSFPFPDNWAGIAIGVTAIFQLIGLFAAVTASEIHRYGRL